MLTMYPHGKESHQPCGTHQAWNMVVQVLVAGKRKKGTKTSERNLCLQNSASLKHISSFLYPQKYRVKASNCAYLNLYVLTLTLPEVRVGQS